MSFLSPLRALPAAQNGFPLSPVQQGMLYHHLRAPHSGVDIEQMVATLREPLRPVAFRTAWNQLVNRHGVFRTGFVWEDLSVPLQVEIERVSLPWQEHDLRSLPVEERRGRLHDFLRHDRLQGFDLRSPPLARGTLFRTDDHEWQFVWTFHHMIADGNSYPALIKEAFARYEALVAGEELTLPEPRPYREFIAWLDSHLTEKRQKAEIYWRDVLRGFCAATPLPGAATTAGNPTGVREKSLRLSAAATLALGAFAREHDLSVAGLVQAAWALVLGAHSESEDVVFGVTRSGRRIALAGAADMVGVLINSPPVRMRLTAEATLLDWLKKLRAEQKSLREFEHTPLVDIQRWSEMPPGAPLFESVLVFTPRLIGAALQELGGHWTNREVRFLEQTNYPLTLFAYHERELLLKLAYEPGRCADGVVEGCLELLQRLLEAFPSSAGRRLAELPLLSVRQERTVLRDWNQTSASYASDRCIHELIEAQAERTPNAVALVFRDRSLTYAELNRRANRIARRLQELGVAPGHFVGIYLARSPDLVIAMLATLKAGAAYVPMDPSYPSQRLSWMLEDSKASVVLTQRELEKSVPSRATKVLFLDLPFPSPMEREDLANLPNSACPSDLAYVIFTSGSSGRPKGVMVEHRNVTNFFAGMDRCLDFKESGTWLAVTSISFDISVLELLWTLARGFKVVLQEEAGRAQAAAASHRATTKMDFSLFYFAAQAGEESKDAYRLLLEGARYADEHGFAAVWTPERHFHAFGGLYPNPAVTSAAVAAITSRVQIRAGSVVLPLHNPIRVAEEWSVVDNLSQGRVGLSFATGWHANDFALMPHNYPERKEITLRGIDVIRRLWRGEAVPSVSGNGAEIQVRIFPRPTQGDPPIWLTSAGNIETFRLAGQMGFNVLTNLLGQDAEELAQKLTAYRQAREVHGHAGKGHVTLMLHTFVGPDLDEVRRKVRGPFLEYLQTSTDLITKARWAFPAFATAPDRHLQPLDDGQLSNDDMQALLDHAFERYFQSSGLFGTPDSCLDMADRLKAIGVDEIACLIDFGVDTASVLEGLSYLNEVRERSNPERCEYSIASQIHRHGVTHLQCTPSLARMLLADPDGLAALRPLRKMLVGGEALPPSVGAELRAAVDGDLINVYGPTETTVWSTAALIDHSDAPVTIGRPLANTHAYVLDRHLRPVPIGVPGELFLGGQGVARGYLNSPELTRDRFIQEPFGTAPEMRLYRTGDRVRYCEDGRLEFLGRLDYQVKIRGHRIELGEIESVLASHPGVRECVVVPSDTAGEQNLVAYVASNSTASATKSCAADPWRSLWDATYSRLAEGSPANHAATLNTTGWISSYTGEPIPENEMREWVEHTVTQILALKPRRILEIGCGTGMLLLRLAPQCAHYHGVDFSSSALRYIQSELTRQRLGNVTLTQAAADELGGLEPASFDVVVINSVIQYFPSVDYLLKVLERVCSLVAAPGSVFIGDVRSLPLQKAFHASVTVEQAPADTRVEDLHRRLRTRLQRDNELVLDPTLFRVLPQHLSTISRVSVRLKRGRSANELTRFRYDVVLGIGGQPAARVPRPRQIDADIDLSTIREELCTGKPVVTFGGIRNPRVAMAVQAAEWLAADIHPETAGALRQTLAASPNEGVHPEDLYALEVPYDVELSWSEHGIDRFDATFRHRSAEQAETPGLPKVEAIGPKAWAEYANRGGVLTEQDLVRELKDLAKQQLPEYMVPATIILLDALPRTPNGKIDRKALPAPDRETATASAAYVAPVTELESTISSVWQELLGRDRVGTHDNFFDLGANSLLMVQASVRLRAALSRELPLVDLFRYPTVSALAAHVGEKNEDQAALQTSKERGRARVDALQRRRAALRDHPVAGT